MNWIDKKYRDNLKDSSFPASTRQKAWEGAQELLDKEFPVASGGGSGAASLLRFGAILLVSASLTSALLWSTFSSSASDNTMGYYNPRTDEVHLNTQDTEAAASSSLAGDQNSDNPNLNDAGDPGQTIAAREQGSSDNAINSEEEFTFDTDEADHVSLSGAGSNTIAESEPSVSNVPLIEQAESSNIQDNIPSASIAAGAALTAGDAPEGSSDDQNERDTRENDNPTGAAPLAVAGTVAGSTSNAVENNINESGVVEDRQEVNLASESTEADEPTEDESGDELIDEVNDVAAGSTAAVLSDTANAEDPLAEESEEEQETEESDEDEVTATAAAGDASKAKLTDWHLSFPESESSNSTVQLPRLNNRRFSVSSWIGYTYTGKLLKADDQAYLDQRKAQEEAINTIPWGINIDYYLDRNWTFSIGVSWAEYGEVLNHQFIITDTVYIDSRNNSPKNYDHIASVDSTRIITGINTGYWNYEIIRKYEDTTIANHNGQTAIQYYEIPVMVGYRFGEGRLKPWINTGISMGIPYRQTFRYLDVGGPVYNESQDMGLIAPLQWSMLLNAGVDYKLSRHLSIRANAISSMHLNSILQDQNVSQRYYRIGGSLGLAYHF